MTAAELDALIEKAVANGGDRATLDALKARALDECGGSLGKLLDAYDYVDDCARMQEHLGEYRPTGINNFAMNWRYP